MKTQQYIISLIARLNPSRPLPHAQRTLARGVPGRFRHSLATYAIALGIIVLFTSGCKNNNTLEIEAKAQNNQNESVVQAVNSPPTDAATETQQDDSPADTDSPDQPDTSDPDSTVDQPPESEPEVTSNPPPASESEPQVQAQEQLSQETPQEDSKTEPTQEEKLQQQEQESDSKNKNNNAEKSESQEKQEQKIAATVSVSSPNGNSSYAVSIPSGSTVEAAMTTAKKQGMSYQTKNYGGMGTYVYAVQGVQEDSAQGLYWIYYLNGCKATVGISSQTLKNGDTILWRYERQNGQPCL